MENKLNKMTQLELNQLAFKKYNKLYNELTTREKELN